VTKLFCKAKSSSTFSDLWTVEVGGDFLSYGGYTNFIWYE